MENHSLPAGGAFGTSRFDFYSFSGYELLISIIQFLLVKMLILDIRNRISMFMITIGRVISDINN